MSLPWAYLQDRNVILCTDDRCHDGDDGDDRCPTKKAHPQYTIFFSVLSDFCQPSEGHRGQEEPSGPMCFKCSTCSVSLFSQIPQKLATLPAL